MVRAIFTPRGNDAGHTLERPQQQLTFQTGEISGYTSHTSWPERLLDPMVIEQDTRASQVTTLHHQPRVSHCINDNYCLNAQVCV